MMVQVQELKEQSFLQCNSIHKSTNKVIRLITDKRFPCFCWYKFAWIALMLCIQYNTDRAPKDSDPFPVTTSEKSKTLTKRFAVLQRGQTDASSQRRGSRWPPPPSVSQSPASLLLVRPRNYGRLGCPGRRGVNWRSPELGCSEAGSEPPWPASPGILRKPP